MRNEIARDHMTICFNFDEEKQTLIVRMFGLYTLSNRKSRLYVPEVTLKQRFEDYWNTIKKKCKPLEWIWLGFGEIDYYSDETDMYETPIFLCKRGRQRAEISHRSWGSIPKDWMIKYTFCFKFNEKSRYKAITDLLRDFLGKERYEYHQKNIVAAIKAMKRDEVSNCIYEEEA